MGYHWLLNQEAVPAEFKALGVESLEEINRFHNVNQLYQHLVQRADAFGEGKVEVPLKNLPQRFRQAKYQALKLENLARKAVSERDPAAHMLRDYSPKTASSQAGSEMVSSNIQYVEPTSLQSTQSPAFYLKHIYELAHTEITSDSQSFALEKRRPDLDDFVLSFENLNEEVTTLSLVNELLVAQLVANEVASNEAALFEVLETTRHPLALPFHRDNAIMRESLRAMSGLRLSTIADRGRQNSYALDQQDFSLVPNPADRLRLYTDHVALLAETPDEKILYGSWYGLADTATGNADLQYVDTFCSATDLSFEEFRKLVRDDVNVKDETDTGYSNMYARFIVGGWYVRLIEEADGRYKTEGYTADDLKNYKPLPATAHEIENKCIRLQRRTGLPFHQLDWLLMTALYGHKSYSINNENIHSEVLSDGTALNVLAHYMEWNERYKLTVDQFTALLADINCYYRAGSGEESLMRQLFRTDAPTVTSRTRRYDNNCLLPICEIETWHFGDILRRGFKLSRREWDAVLTEVSEEETDILDSLMMGRVYRLATIFRLLGWSVLEGIALTRRVDPSLMRKLGKSNLCGDVLLTLDRLSWLKDWMVRSEFSPTELMTLMVKPPEARFYSNQDILNWVEELQRGLRTALLAVSDFTAYTRWEGSSDSEVSQSEWLTALQDKDVVDTRGLVKAERDAIKTAAMEVLTERGIDVAYTGTQERIDELTGSLVGKKDAQNSVVATQISKQSKSLSQVGVELVLKWMGSSYYAAKEIFFDWSTAKDPSNTAGLQYLFDIHRHLLVVDKMKMEVPEIELPADYPARIAVGMTTTLSLPQVYLLSRFDWLQNAEVSANDWLAYFTKIDIEITENGGTPPGDQTGNHEMLARLLDWPAEEIAQLAVGIDIGIENGCVATIQQADFLARRIALCQDAAIGAGELIALEDANGAASDFATACAAAMVGLKRFEKGVYVDIAKGEIDEEVRDALVGSYMTQVVAVDPTLKDVITTDEDLYQYLLLDVKVSSEVPTTRMLENTGAVQLYINRILGNVEQASFVDRNAFRAIWETAHQYRVWEANEKLALYPSNYTEPELRRGKSEIFTNFEQDLSQGDLNEDTIEMAIHGYLTGLQRLSELQAHGFFFTHNQNKVIYYFTARASWEKHGYYYRKLEIDRLLLKDGSPFALDWGDWKNVNLPIAVEQVYGVVPAFAWNRLFLFWLELKKVTVTESNPDGRTRDRYFLRPKCTRQNLSSGFTDPWSPALGDGIDLEVTDLIGGDPTFNEPVFYQAYYDMNKDKIVLYFSLDTEKQVKYVWTLSGSTSRNEINTTVVELGTLKSLPDYDNIPHSLGAVSSRYGISISPPDHRDSFETSWNFGSGMKLTISKYVWEVSQVEHTTKINYYWSAESGYLNVIEQGSRSTYLDNVVVRIAVNDTEVGQKIVHHRKKEDGPLTFLTASGCVELDPNSPKDNLIRFSIHATGTRGDMHGDDDQREDEVVHESHCQTSVLYHTEGSHLFCGRQHVTREAERYLLSTEEELIVSLFSTGTHELTSKVFPGYDIRNLFALENQQPEEKGVSNFLNQVETATDPNYGPIQEPKPKAKLDFNGPYGLYAWEVFYHIPSMIASKHCQAGQYHQALLWQRCIYDPQAELGEQWKVWPLIEQDGAFTFSITDPDKIAREQPVYYQLSTIRHYLQAMIDEGDSYYRQQTTETLRQAKMCYVAADGLFVHEAGKALERSTRDDWNDPKLGSVTTMDFRPPYNQEVREAYDTLQQRLDNLRNWRSIDGEPLNIPLLTPPLDPRQLQMTAVSGHPATQAGAAGAAGAAQLLPYSFDTALAKAKAAVESLMYFGDLLTRGLYRQDQQTITELKTKLAHHVSENFEVGGQKSLICSLLHEEDVLEKNLEEAEKYLTWYTRFADEVANNKEKQAYAMLGLKTQMHSAAAVQALLKGSLKLIPNIFGFSVGGSKGEGPVEGSQDVSENLAESYATVADIWFHKGEVQRRQEENEMERDATTLAVQSIRKSIKRLKYDIGEERGTLDVLKEKARQTQALVDFQARRSTNADFYNWYVGRIAAHYNSAYDITVRFCRLAERTYQFEVGDPKASFVNPGWDAMYHGLLSGQSLMLDLQRMDYAYMERYQPPTEGKLSISLSALNPLLLEALKRGGRTLFTLDEALFDRKFPDEYERRIKSIRIRLPGIGNSQEVNARLALIGHWVHFDRNKSKDRSAPNVFGRHQISLLSAETNTGEMQLQGNRFRPFERCGVESTWKLSFPAVVKAIEAKQTIFEQQMLLEQLEDVLLDVHYTARI